ncbi:MAG TPA: carboxypeptidase regulatory-like domain-containing protein, partial [Candidatus Bathyarchaeota archaeon]|nr:carboxypeptidase regulatory-like domain-containing protein [Candidatus Bathyarchaeota archaeon]
MRGSSTALLSAILLLALAQGAMVHLIPQASAAPSCGPSADHAMSIPVPVGNVTTHHGDLVVSGSDKLVIRNVDFTLYGSIVAMDHAQVIIDNAILTLCEVDGEMGNITIRDHAYIEVINSTITGERTFYLYLLGDSRALFQGATFENSHEFYGAAEVTVQNSRLVWVDCYGSVDVSINNTIVEFELSATDNAYVLIRNSEVGSVYLGPLRAQGGATIEAYDCTVFFKADCRDNATLMLYNVSSPSVELIPPSPGEVGKARIYVGWHLNVSVFLSGQPISGAEVKVYFGNGSLAGEGLTGPNGSLDMLLLERVLYLKDHSVMEDPLRDYIVRASHEGLEGEAQVVLDDNKEVHVDLLSTLTVRCLDGDGEAVGGVKVVLKPLGAERLTDDEGKAYFTLLEAGSYELTAYYMGVRVAGPEAIEITDVSTYDVELSCSIYDLVVLVLSAGGEPIGGARVKLMFVNGTPIYESLTDPSGRVEFENLPAASYKLAVEARGYKGAERTIKL